MQSGSHPWWLHWIGAAFGRWLQQAIQNTHLCSLGGVYDQRYVQEWVYLVAITQEGVSLNIGGILVSGGQSYC
jgi:hypothetical protein